MQNNSRLLNFVLLSANSVVAFFISIFCVLLMFLSVIHLVGTLFLSSHLDGWRLFSSSLSKSSFLYSAEPFFVWIEIISWFIVTLSIFRKILFELEKK
ncbi:hypothetical protein C0584_02500 [Candidatus Parcubacteria bacterium]|nr:MAG: hypothetical protein C0584_02500 [Candidatus Parcubacteria bacterium]